MPTPASSETGTPDAAGEVLDHRDRDVDETRHTLGRGQADLVAHHAVAVERDTEHLGAADVEPDGPRA